MISNNIQLVGHHHESLSSSPSNPLQDHDQLAAADDDGQNYKICALKTQSSTFTTTVLLTETSVLDGNNNYDDIDDDDDSSFTQFGDQQLSLWKPSGIWWKDFWYFCGPGKIMKEGRLIESLTDSFICS
jgi:hypothetical protein